MAARTGITPAHRLALCDSDERTERHPSPHAGSGAQIWYATSCWWPIHPGPTSFHFGRSRPRFVTYAAGSVLDPLWLHAPRSHRGKDVVRWSALLGTQMSDHTPTRNRSPLITHLPCTENHCWKCHIQGAPIPTGTPIRALRGAPYLRPSIRTGMWCQHRSAIAQR